VKDINQQADRINIVYYTDPLCCWSWAFEPHWHRFLAAFSEQISYRYCMGGLIPDWDKFSDPMNSVSRPIQMGPVWMEAKHMTGVEIDDTLWMRDPPSSSYPACIAVKTAGLQSFDSGELYLKHLRRAVMTEGKNIAKPEVLLEIAEQTSRLYPERFNVVTFKKAFNSEASRQAFRDDLSKIRYNKIGRFPTLTMSRPDGKGIMITGFRPFEALVEAFRQVLPEHKTQVQL
jgi:putative protein-disulfide isomerase